MAHFSASGDSIASVFITIRIGFERCSFCVAEPGHLLLRLSQDVVFLITAICLLILSLSL